MIEWFAAEKKGVANAYAFFQPRAPAVPWVSVVWRPKIMLKHRFILWLLAKGKLRTADRMVYESVMTCVLCQSVEESNAHLFFECPTTHMLWNKVMMWLGISLDCRTAGELLQLLGRRCAGGRSRSKARHLALSSMVYVLWEAHNRRKFEGLSPDVDRMLRKIQIHVYRFVDLRCL